MKGGLFGVIPIEKTSGGYCILRKLNLENRLVGNVEMSNFRRTKEGFLVRLNGYGKEEIKVRNLVLATGGIGGKFDNTDNFRYSKYNTFDLVKNNGGIVKDLENLFIHPFGFNKGKRILIGADLVKGEFVDFEGNLVFNEKIRKLIKNNNYHESFYDILENIKRRKDNVFFVDDSRKIEVSPTVHYTGGGIKCDVFGNVENVEGLFAIGECRADGSINGGRLPGYAFTSAIVDGKKLAELIAFRLNRKKIN